VKPNRVHRPSSSETPAPIASRASTVPMAGIVMLPTCSRPVTMSQLPSKSIPRFFVSSMLFTSLSTQRVRNTADTVCCGVTQQWPSRPNTNVMGLLRTGSHCHRPHERSQSVHRSLQAQKDSMTRNNFPAWELLDRAISSVPLRPSRQN
jgi:hypothetical protein